MLLGPPLRLLEPRCASLVPVILRLAKVSGTRLARARTHDERIPVTVRTRLHLVVVIVQRHIVTGDVWSRLDLGVA